MVGTGDNRAIAAVSISQATRNAPDGGNADTGQVVYFSVGKTLPKVFDDLPPIDQCLELGGSTKVFKEIAAFSNALETDYGLKKFVFSTCLLTLSVVSIRFHECTNVLMRTSTLIHSFSRCNPQSGDIGRYAACVPLAPLVPGFIVAIIGFR